MGDQSFDPGERPLDINNGKYIFVVQVKPSKDNFFWGGV